MHWSRTAERARDAAEQRLGALVHQWSPSRSLDSNPHLAFEDVLDHDVTAAGPRVSVGPWSRSALRGLVALLAVILVVIGYLVWQSQPRDVVSVPAADESRGSPIEEATAITPEVLATGPPLTGSSGSPPVPAATTAVEDDSGGVPESTDATGIVVHVTGLVRRPGLVRLPAGARVADAIDLAGGITRRRAEGSVNLARVLVDGEQIVVADAAMPQPVAPAASGATPPAALGAPVDLNSATIEQLDGLPGVGPVLAGRILQWRTTHGRFRSVDELGEVSGIGDAILGQLRPLVRV